MTESETESERRVGNQEITILLMDIKSELKTNTTMTEATDRTIRGSNGNKGMVAELEVTRTMATTNEKSIGKIWKSFATVVGLAAAWFGKKVFF